MKLIFFRLALNFSNGINAAQNQIKDFLDYLEFYFTNSAIINPKIDFVKQYLYAINNTVLAKLKNLFLYYRTSSAITDLTKSVFPYYQKKTRARTNKWKEEARFRWKLQTIQ